MDELLRRLDHLDKQIDSLGDSERQAGMTRLLEVLKASGIPLTDSETALVGRFERGEASFDELSKGLAEKLVNL